MGVEAWEKYFRREIVPQVSIPRRLASGLTRCLEIAQLKFSYASFAHNLGENWAYIAHNKPFSLMKSFTG